MVTSRDARPAGTGSRKPDEDPPRRPDFGLVVGVDHYTGLSRLRGAVEDANRFYDWMCDEHGGGVLPEHARIVRSSEQPPTPVQKQVDEALKELIDMANASEGGGRLYFHFSGHGALRSERSEDVALLLATWQRIHSEIALSSHDYRETLVTAGVFQEVAIFLDCCRSPGARAVLDPTFTLTHCTKQFDTAWLVACATANGHNAFEAGVADRWQGVFTKCLLKILAESPSALSAEALRRRLNKELKNENAMRQRATLIHGLDAHSTFGKGSLRYPIEIRFESTTGHVWLIDGNQDVVGRHQADAGPWTLSLKPGKYRLELPTTPAVDIDHRATQVVTIDHGLRR